MGGTIVKKKVIIGIFLILLISVIVTLNVMSANKGESGIPVKMVMAEKQDVSSYVLTKGVVEAEEKELIYIEGDARIGKVYAKAGDKVEAGQVLATLDIKDISSELEQEKINLEVEELSLQKLEQQYKPQDTLQAEQSVKAAQKNITFVQKNYNNYKILYDEGSISKAELDKAEIEFDAAETELQRSKNTLETILKDNKEIQATRLNEIAIQENKIAMTKLKVKQLQEQFDVLKENVISPIAGVVTQVNIIDGEYVAKGTLAFTVTDINRLIVKVNVNDYDIGKVAVGQKVEITGNGLQGKIYIGEIKGIAAVANRIQMGNIQETVVEVFIEVIDQDEHIKSGFSIDAKILTQEDKEAIVVPYEVLKTREDNSKVVYVYREGMAKEIEIETGIESDLVIQIIGDVKEGEKIISNYGDNIEDGTKVKPIMNKNDKKQGAKND